MMLLSGAKDEETLNFYRYEKVGYHQTGEIEHIKDGMDIVYFEKN